MKTKYFCVCLCFVLHADAALLKSVDVDNVGDKGLVPEGERPIIDEGGLDPNLIKMDPPEQPSSELQADIGSLLLPGPQLVTDFHDEDEEGIREEEEPSTTVSDEGDAVTPTELPAVTETARDDGEWTDSDPFEETNMPDDGHVPLKTGDDRMMTGNENWGDVDNVSEDTDATDDGHEPLKTGDDRMMTGNENWGKMEDESDGIAITKVDEIEKYNNDSNRVDINDDEENFEENEFDDDYEEDLEGGEDNKEEEKVEEEKEQEVGNDDVSEDNHLVEYKEENYNNSDDEDIDENYDEDYYDEDYDDNNHFIEYNEKNYDDDDDDDDNYNYNEDEENADDKAASDRKYEVGVTTAVWGRDNYEEDMDDKASLDKEDKVEGTSLPWWKEKSEEDYHYDDEYSENDDRQGKTSTISWESDWNAQEKDTTESLFNEDSGDSKKQGGEVEAGKNLMESVHHFDNNIGMFAGAKVSASPNHAFELPKKSVFESPFYMWAIFLTLFTAMLLLFVFWKRHTIGRYIVSLRDPKQKATNGLKKQEEERNLLRHEFV